MDDVEISVGDPKGELLTLRWDRLSQVVIETNDSGPWGADLWWLLFDTEDQVACVFPEGATGEPSAVERITELEAFDHQQMMEAMRCVENSTFTVWRAVASSR